MLQTSLKKIHWRIYQFGTDSNGYSTISNAYEKVVQRIEPYRIAKRTLSFLAYFVSSSGRVHLQAVRFEVAGPVRAPSTTCEPQELLPIDCMSHKNRASFILRVFLRAELLSLAMKAIYRRYHVLNLCPQG